MNQHQTEVLENLEAHLLSLILGQEHAIKEVAKILRIGEMGLAEPTRPKGSFLFLGPTGVGKTELALSFTRYLFDESNLVRLDMSEFQHPDSIFQFVGRPGLPGQFQQRLESTGGKGTILLDEIEKAYPPILDLLLQILDNGRLTLASGEVLDLCPYYIVLTSNIASKAVIQARQRSGATLRRFVETRAQQVLRPELFSRIDSAQVFNRLSWEVLLKIAEGIRQAEIERLGRRGIKIESAPTLEGLVNDSGRNVALGARPLKRLINRQLRLRALSIRVGAS